MLARAAKSSHHAADHQRQRPSLGESNALAALGEGRSPARCAAINREGDEDKDSRSGPNDNCFASSV